MASTDKPVFVLAEDAPWTIAPIEKTDDPQWYRLINDCDDTCHHPVHAFHPERRQHLIEADLAETAIANNWVDPDAR